MLLATAVTKLICFSRICWCVFAKNSNQAVNVSSLFFSFVASYVSAMVPVKSPKEYYVQQEVIVLFCETVERYIYRGIYALNNYSL